MAAAVLQISSSLCTSVRDTVVISTPLRLSSSSPFRPSSLARLGTTFATGSPLLLRTSYPTKHAPKGALVTVRCEQSSKESSSSLDVWLGRFAMLGFAIAISVEISTGKGLLENFGLITPLPTVALGVTALVGILTAVFIFQSASKN
ncbi:PREDICTED: stress enhanced protein 1, chloroplastic isoform X2 [Ipomoea nil]|uniref:stress enhanced protein 1, chloroplastic isoform X2 n=1 Tax=Ipomoea nil TaxID=35883 RepID=UPI000901309F|nr:PREDICTED: stress enhanced protein 1, chloroplastic isoform X2 [Ipomoea nil]